MRLVRWLLVMSFTMLRSIYPLHGVGWINPFIFCTFIFVSKTLCFKNLWIWVAQIQLSQLFIQIFINMEIAETAIRLAR